MGGKCKDGVVLVSDSKVTYYDDHPPSYQYKLDGSLQANHHQSSNSNLFLISIFDNAF
jgi:hypothetical protein